MPPRRKPTRRRRKSPSDAMSDSTRTSPRRAARWKPIARRPAFDRATIQAARALHVERGIGSIEVGKRADLAVVSLKGAHTTPFYPETVIGHLVYSGRGSDVQATIVDGQILMSGGVVRTVDEADVIARAQETARELFEA